MADLKQEAPVLTPRENQEFVLNPKLKAPDKVTLYKVGKKSMFLNHSDTVLEVKGIKVPVATSAQLKEMYDSDASYAKFVIPPAGYVAPWAKK